MLIDETPTAAPGVKTVGAAPAPGIDTPYPTRKSLTPPPHEIFALPLVVLQVIAGGVKLPKYAPKSEMSALGLGPLVRKSAPIFCGAVKVLATLSCAPLPEA